jgi:hypothetical protein
MKRNNILTIAVLGLFLTVPFTMRAQDREDMSKKEIAKMDSVQFADARAEQLQKTTDETRMAEAKLDKKQTRAKSKDAKRVEQEATNAAHESKAALRAEKKAQKSRKQATKQAKKASDARAQSDKN